MFPTGTGTKNDPLGKHPTANLNTVSEVTERVVPFEGEEHRVLIEHRASHFFASIPTTMPVAKKMDCAISFAFSRVAKFLSTALPLLLLK